MCSRVVYWTVAGVSFLVAFDTACACVHFVIFVCILGLRSIAVFYLA